MYGGGLAATWRFPYLPFTETDRSNLVNCRARSGESSRKRRSGDILLRFKEIRSFPLGAKLCCEARRRIDPR